MQTLFTFLIAALFGGICAFYAKQRGRDPLNWFFIGIFLGVIGLILLFILPVKKAPELAPQVDTLPVPTEEPVFPQNDFLSSSKPPLFWYYLDPENKQFGPMSFEGLQTAWKDGKVIDQTYIWNEEMSNWKHFGEVFKNEETPS